MLKHFVVLGSCVLMLAACGKSEPATPAEQPASAPAATAAASAPTAVAVAEVSNPVGEKTFKSVCSMCHQSGAAGAPILGNKDDWSPRITQGKDTLYKHALEGFSGQKGAMPAKGGNPSLSDADVKAAVDFMVAKAS
ncbi:cytochrome c5 family protein [Aquitalea sp. FJL05]|uniref:c-type cytochrome n=1 Tax=Aquitalea TaxID=407217 RepID=UPI000F5B80B5|nr:MULTISPECIES: c-type cytochrome [Aquitalea]RQO65757.1 cytochrome c5 family protein [Aquitalea sp. FJL05]